MIKKKQKQKGALLFDLMTELCLGKVLHGRTGMGGKHVCLQKSVLGCRQSTAALWTKPSYAAWGEISLSEAEAEDLGRLRCHAKGRNCDAAAFIGMFIYISQCLPPSLS